MSKKKISIIGAGTMGQGITQVFLQHGYKVILIDIDLDILKKAKNKIADIYSKLVAKEKISQEDKDLYMDNLNISEDFKLLKDIPVIIETIKEDLKIKITLIKSIEEMVSGEAIIASNTSSLSITEIASGLIRPERFIGLHFFNPAPLLGLVEVVIGNKTSGKVKDKIISLVKDIEKEPIIVKDSPGFIVNRLTIPYINEAIALFSEEIASREDIDNAMRLGANYQMGPLELADYIGLDVCLNIMENLYRDLNDSKYKPSRLLCKMVKLGKIGRKTEEGFYKY
ncbi:MAG: 3-hydroxybutyryl-CoA dehydrogenase [Actinomycetia bacterium]|nr:3-hydroxybutyryl-CoA dehydrogenase [Actinomycetes bacterium]